MIAPSDVAAAANRREDENIRFRSFLKNRADSDKLDEQFLALHNELFANYDCRKCNNCCREYSTILQEEEIGAIAAYLGMSKQELVEKHLAQTNEGYEIKAPCGFLKENGECAIQACKPGECLGFPYTNKPERLFSLYGVLEFAGVCPVVYEILERLKGIYRFRR